MSWACESLTSKAKAFAERAYQADVTSDQFGFWMSLSLELLGRAALAKIHPALLSDGKLDSTAYALGLSADKEPTSIGAKEVYARCKRFLSPNFTQEMVYVCEILAVKRNSELHTGAFAFQTFRSEQWLADAYSAMNVLVGHVGTNLEQFLGFDHAPTARKVITSRADDRRDEIRRRIGERKGYFQRMPESERERKTAFVDENMLKLLAKDRFQVECICPACSNRAAIRGSAISWSQWRFDPQKAVMTRQVRLVPVNFRCLICDLRLAGFPEIEAAGIGGIQAVDETNEYSQIVAQIEFDRLMTEFMALPEDNTGAEDQIEA